MRFEGKEELKEADEGMYDWLTRMCRGDFVLSYGCGGDSIDGIGILQDDEPFYDKDRSSFRWLRNVKWILTGKAIRVTDINNIGFPQNL